MSSLSEPPLVRKSKNSLLLSLLRDGSRLLGRGCGGELGASMKQKNMNVLAILILFDELEEGGGGELGASMQQKI